MLTIRFRRTGKKNKAYFKLILQDKQQAPPKKHIEILGSYDPHLKKAILKEERIKYWLGQGVQPSDTVYNLLVTKGIISDKKRAVKIPTKSSTEPKKSTETEAKTEDKKEAEEKKTEEKEEKKENTEKEENKEEKTEEEDKKEEKIQEAEKPKIKG